MSDTVNVNLNDYIIMLSEAMYQSQADRHVEDLVNLLESINKFLADKNIQPDNLNYLNTIVENMLSAMETKDWIFAGDILRYELSNFVEEVM